MFTKTVIQKISQVAFATWLIKNHALFATGLLKLWPDQPAINAGNALTAGDYQLSPSTALLVAVSFVVTVII